MDEKDEKIIAEKIMNSIKEKYGFVPLVNEVMYDRPDLFIPSANLSKAVLENDKQRLEAKTKYLCAVSAATAAGGEYCLEVQMKHAVAAGATKDEVFEAILIGSYVCMTKSQSYAFRKYKAFFEEK